MVSDFPEDWRAGRGRGGVRWGVLRFRFSLALRVGAPGHLLQALEERFRHLLSMWCAHTGLGRKSFVSTVSTILGVGRRN